MRMDASGCLIQFGLASKRLAGNSMASKTLGSQGRDAIKDSSLPSRAFMIIA